MSDSTINSEARLVRILDIFNLNPFFTILRRKFLYVSLLTLLIKDIKIRLIERDKKNKNDARDLKS